MCNPVRIIPKGAYKVDLSPLFYLFFTCLIRAFDKIYHWQSRAFGYVASLAFLQEKGRQFSNGLHSLCKEEQRIWPRKS